MLLYSTPMFSLLNPCIHSKNWPKNFAQLELSHKIVVIPRERQSFYISTQLFNYMVSLFVETESFSSVHNLSQQLWLSQGSKDKFLSKTTITSILTPYLMFHANALVRLQQQHLINEASRSLSADHTYKFVKHLSVSSPENSRKKVNFFSIHFINIFYLKIHIPAQLFTVLNDNGKVVYHKIVPDGSHLHVKEAIKTIVAKQKSVVTEVFYSDKVRNVFPKKFIPGCCRYKFSTSF
jgi:hypothetical protein